MVKINPNNLEWAFRKLKTYYYYYHSSLFLKKKIVEFENKLNTNQINFEQISQSLNKYYGSLINIDVLSYPKKESIKYYNGKVFIDDAQVDFFIDLDIVYYLVDIIFSYNLFEKASKFISSDSYAGLMDERISNFDFNNNFLLKNYHWCYKKWKNVPQDTCGENPNVLFTAVKLDMKNCFNSIRFNFNTILETLGLEKDISSTIMKSIFNIYTARLSRKLHFTKEKNVCLLPIGLISSNILLNIILNEVDHSISQNSIAFKYARYVDDMVIMIKNNNRSNVFEMLTTNFNDVFYKENDEIYIRASGFLVSKVKINGNKTFSKLVSSDKISVDWRKFYNRTSYIDYDDDERDNSSENVEDELTLSKIRRQIYYFANNKEGNKNNITQYIDSLNEIEFLNCYSIWTDLFKIVDAQYATTVKERVIEAINKVSNDNHGKAIIATLTKEINDAYFFAFADYKKACYMVDLPYYAIHEYIENIYEDKNHYEYFPHTASIADISYYFAKRYIGNFDLNMKEKTIDLYVKLNHAHNIGAYGINSFTYNSKKIETEKLIYFSGHDSSAETYRIALGALNMNDLEKAVTLKDEIPKNYDLNTIIELIDKAARDQASFLVLPEFAIDEDWIDRIIKTARKYHMSVISGITHQMMADGNHVINLTLIYESVSGMVFQKPKNYMPPFELKFIKNLGKTPYIPHTPYYINVKYGNLSYVTMTCYEVTNIHDRCAMANKINCLYMPVYNKDTNYFSAIINSFSRDISCFIAQSNSNNLGDTCIRQPTSSICADIIKAKGGVNNYIIVGEINTSKLIKDNNSYIKDRLSYDDKKDVCFKKLSAGDYHYKP